MNCNYIIKLNMNLNQLTHMKLSEIETSDIAGRFWSQVDKSGDCWIWLGWRWKGEGYGHFGIKRNGKWQKMYAHRMAYLLEHGEIPERLHVCHTCDNPPCVNPKHLWLGTFRDNIQDAVNKGRLDNSGEANHFAKLSLEQVDEIRERHKAGEKVPALAKEYGIKFVQTYRILRGESWAASCVEPARLRSGHTWTEAEIKDVRARRVSGETLKSIASSYDVDFTRIWQIDKLGPGYKATQQRHDWTEEEKEDILLRRARGETQESIGKSYNVGRSRVRQLLMRWS